MKNNTEILASIKNVIANADAKQLSASDTIIKITWLLADAERTKSLHDLSIAMKSAEDDEKYYGIGGADAYSNH